MNLRGLIGRAEPKDAGLPANASYLYCPLCGYVVHGYDHYHDLRHPDDIGAQAELFSVEHLRRHHRLRWWLWQRTKWRWVVAGFMG